MSWWKQKKGKELKPRHSLWNLGLSARKPFKDTDKDKVIDMFDCQPKNKRKQGEEHEEEKPQKELSRTQKKKALRDFYGYSKKEAREMLEDMGE